MEVLTLRSLAQREDRPVCFIDQKLLTTLADDLDIIRVVAHTVIDYVVDESHKVYIFSDWLMQWHAMLHDPISAAAKDAEKRVAETDYPPVLDFILWSMTRNPLNIFLGRSTEQVTAANRRPKQFLTRKTVDMMLKRHEEVQMQPASPIVDLLNMLYLTLFINDATNKLCELHREKFSTSTYISQSYQIMAPLSEDSTSKLIMLLDPPQPLHESKISFSTFVATILGPRSCKHIPPRAFCVSIIDSAN